MVLQSTLYLDTFVEAEIYTPGPRCIVGTTALGGGEHAANYRQEY